MVEESLQGTDISTNIPECPVSRFLSLAITDSCSVPGVSGDLHQELPDLQLRQRPLHVRDVQGADEPQGRHVGNVLQCFPVFLLQEAYLCIHT